MTHGIPAQWQMPATQTVHPAQWEWQAADPAPAEWVVPGRATTPPVDAVTDLVYFVRPGEENEELRYSLRSVARNLPHNKIWIVGYTPSWVTGVESVVGNRMTTKQQNVFDNVRLACAEPGIPSEFIIMNDDFMIVRPGGDRVIYRGLLADHISSLKNQASWWARSLRCAYSWLRQNGIDEPLSYDLHQPLWVVKDWMAQALAECAHVHPQNPPQWRTVYGNRWNIGGVQVVDSKISTTSGPPTTDAPCISTTDASFERSDAAAAIRAQFPTPSPYEKAL